MAKFAKLFDLKDGEQVLLTINYNDDEDKFELELRTEVEGCTASIKLGFDEEEKSINAMDKYKDENAEAFRNDMVKMFE